ncbi:MAG: PAS domain S-box protein [Candidatus Delongbacteria bacterium]|nr:PAS domain S-box protein [Candidatus Delongbacteria bacterium]
MNELYRNILEELPSGVWVTDSNDKVIYINKAMAEIAGASVEQFTGLEVFKDLDKPGNNEFLSCFKKVKANLFPGEYEVRLQDNKGKEFVHRGWLTPLVKDGKYDGMIVTAEDITEKDIYFKAMKDSEEKFRRTIEFAADGILLGSPDGYITEANQAACELFGMSKKEMLNIHISKMPFTEESIQRTPMRFDLLKEGKTVIRERAIKRRDGSEIVIEMKTKMMEDGTYQSIYRDITEKKSNEKTILELNESLEQKVKDRTSQLEAVNKELESFSYSVSHDLRAPVRHISGFTDILAKSLDPDERTAETINKIKTAACKMEKLIDDLLEFSKTGSLELSRNRLNMNPIIEAVKKELCESDPVKKIEWKISDLPSVYCDRNLIKIVWENLIGNACKYSANSEPAVIEIGYSEKKKEYEFYIKDNGVGFDPEFYDKLFGVFQRLHHEKDFPGTGIGLATVKRIISRHSGSVRAESEGEGKGACFYFSIPKIQREKE